MTHEMLAINECLLSDKIIFDTEKCGDLHFYLIDHDSKALNNCKYFKAGNNFWQNVSFHFLKS